jgi:hypothetical protein
VTVFNLPDTLQTEDFNGTYLLITTPIDKPLSRWQTVTTALGTKMIIRTSQKAWSYTYILTHIRCYGMTGVSSRLCPQNEAVRKSTIAWRQQMTNEVLRLTNVIKNHEGLAVWGFVLRTRKARDRRTRHTVALLLPWRVHTQTNTHTHTHSNRSYNQEDITICSTSQKAVLRRFMA